MNNINVEFKKVTGLDLNRPYCRMLNNQIVWSTFIPVPVYFNFESGFSYASISESMSFLFKPKKESKKVVLLKPMVIFIN